MVLAPSHPNTTHFKSSVRTQISNNNDIEHQVTMSTQATRPKQTTFKSQSNSNISFTRIAVNPWSQLLIEHWHVCNSDYIHVPPSSHSIELAIAQEASHSWSPSFCWLPQAKRTATLPHRQTRAPNPRRLSPLVRLKLLFSARPKLSQVIHNLAGTCC